MTEMTEDRFQAAVAQSKLLTQRPDNATLLQLYASYKQATEGDVQGDAPGWTDPVGRAKWQAWDALRGTDAPAARERYVQLVESLQRGESEG